MIDIKFKDWKKNRPKKLYNHLHDLRVFEIIFSKKLEALNFMLNELDSIQVFCLADTEKQVSFKPDYAIGKLQISIPYDYISVANLLTAKEKFQVFSKLIYLYIVPAMENYSEFSLSIISEYVREALEQVVKQNYEVVFLVGKTPKKSPGRKKIAILKGIHRSEGFQLRCEVYDEKGIRITNQLLVEEVGNEIVYQQHLGNLKWENENIITVNSKSKIRDWSYEIRMDN